MKGNVSDVLMRKHKETRMTVDGAMELVGDGSRVWRFYGAVKQKRAFARYRSVTRAEPSRSKKFKLDSGFEI